MRVQRTSLRSPLTRKAFGWRRPRHAFVFLLGCAIGTPISAADAVVVKTIVPFDLSSKVAAVEIDVEKATSGAESCAGPKAEVWKGRFRAVATLESGKRVATSLNDVTGESELTFLKTGAPQIEFNDYNNDGDPDFALELTSCMNRSGYHLLTISRSGRITALPVAGDRFGTVSSSFGIYPTEDGFRAGVYDNTAST